MANLFKKLDINVDGPLNVVCDIAGQYKATKALLEKMPSGTPVSIGDMVDRGPQSFEVLNFFKSCGLAVMGNHEHMMVDYLNSNGVYSRLNHPFLFNGGNATLANFKKFNENEVDRLVQWAASLPVGFIVENTNKGTVLLSHAPLDAHMGPLDQLQHPDEQEEIVWNRVRPRDLPVGIDYQINGHNSHWGHTEMFGHSLCIDSSRSKVLTGIHLPTFEIFTQEFLD